MIFPWLTISDAGSPDSNLCSQALSCTPCGEAAWTTDEDEDETTAGTGAAAGQGSLCKAMTCTYTISLKINSCISIMGSSAHPDSHILCESHAKMTEPVEDCLTFLPKPVSTIAL